MCDWESQHLPGILEDLPPMSMPLPCKALSEITERMGQLREVDIPDWLDGDPTNDELYALFVTLDTWAILIDMIRRSGIKKAVLS